MAGRDPDQCIAAAADTADISLQQLGANIHQWEKRLAERKEKAIGIG